MRSSMRFIFIFSYLIFLSSCFTESETSGKLDSSSTSASLITPSAFKGASSAVNKITGVQISWQASTVEPIAYRVYRVNGTKLTLLTTLAPNVYAFIDGSVTWGNLYSYIVRAVDLNNIEDSNTVKVSSLSWAGISNVESTSRSSLTVNFGSTTAVADEIRIYIEPAAGGQRVLAETISGSETTATLTGLRTGFRYRVSAQAYIESLKKEDGNDAVFYAATKTLAYHSENGSDPAWMNVTNVRAFGQSPSAPVHPTFPERTPRIEIVELSFNSFNGLDAATKYVVTRTSVENPIDTSVQNLCDPNTKTSCRVKCTANSAYLSGVGVLHCRDEKAGAAPVKYRYSMSIERTEDNITWVEPLDASEVENFSVLVPMPPPNMILVQRDAVNFEMCNQMNSATDPLNHNRCPYLGVGASPYNAGPGRPTLSFDYGFYDFGYNLFADRFEQGCKWTRAADGGMCGPGGTPGDCVTYSNYSSPPSTIGKNGDILFVLWGGNTSNAVTETACFYKFANNWVRSNSVLSAVYNAQSVLGAMFTSDPAANNGKIAAGKEYSTPVQANAICQSQVDINYGPKRLPRKREHHAYSTFPTMPNDLYGVTYAQSSTIRNGGGYNSTAGYNCPTYFNNSNTSIATNIADMLSGSYTTMAIYTGGNYYGATFSLNSPLTADCQSRYGMQHPMGTAGVWMSDIFNYNQATKNLTGAASPLDSGNRDLLQDITGGQSGFQINFSTSTANGTSSYYFMVAPNGASSPVNFVSLPLGNPILAATSSVYLPRPSLIEHYNAAMHFPYTTMPSGPVSVRVQDRWQTATNNTYPGGPTVSSLRCVMSAD